MAKKVFNGLPYNLKEISNNPKMVNLKDILSSNSFYTWEEFFFNDYCIICVNIE
jgi:hypothetical protein